MRIRTAFLTVLLLTPCAVVAQPAPTPQARPEQTRPPAPPPPTTTVPAPARGQVINTLVQPQTRGEQAARRAGQPVNIKVDVTFHDQTASEPRRTKTVTVVTADGLTGFVRTTANYEGPGGGRMPLNIDVEPQILTGGKIRLLLNFQFTLPVLDAGGRTTSDVMLRSTEISENLSLVLDDGKSMVVSQSADPVGDRRVTVEVLATISR